MIIMEYWNVLGNVLAVIGSLHLWIVHVPVHPYLHPYLHSYLHSMFADLLVIIYTTSVILVNLGASLIKDILREKCPYLEFYWSVFSLNVGKYGPEKLRIRTLFMQWQVVNLVPHLSIQPKFYFVFSKLCRDIAKKFFIVHNLLKNTEGHKKFFHPYQEKYLRQHFLAHVFYALYFFPSGFSFTNIHDSQDSRGRGRLFL